MAETEGGSPKYRSRFPEIYIDVVESPPASTEIIRTPRTQIRMLNEIAITRERIRNLRMNTITDVVICICAISVTTSIIWWLYKE